MGRAGPLGSACELLSKLPRSCGVPSNPGVSKHRFHTRNLVASPNLGFCFLNFRLLRPWGLQVSATMGFLSCSLLLGFARPVLGLWSVVLLGFARLRLASLSLTPNVFVPQIFKIFFNFWRFLEFSVFFFVLVFWIYPFFGDFRNFNLIKSCSGKPSNLADIRSYSVFLTFEPPLPSPPTPRLNP